MKKVYLFILILSIYTNGNTQDLLNVQPGTKIKIKLKKKFNNVKIKYEFRDIMKKMGNQNKIIVNYQDENDQLIRFKFPKIIETFSVKRELIESVEIHKGFKREILSYTLWGFATGSLMGFILSYPANWDKKFLEMSRIESSIAFGGINGAFIGAIVGVFAKSEKWERVSIGNISNNKNRFSHGYTFFDLGFSFK